MRWNSCRAGTVGAGLGWVGGLLDGRGGGGGYRVRYLAGWPAGRTGGVLAGSWEGGGIGGCWAVLGEYHIILIGFWGGVR